jgi:hypothetical protein
MTTRDINTLLARALTQEATLTDLEAVPPATVTSLPDPLLFAYSAIMSDLVENGTADAERILAKANGHAGPLRETFIELLDKAPEHVHFILDSVPVDSVHRGRRACSPLSRRDVPPV